MQFTGTFLVSYRVTNLGKRPNFTIILLHPLRLFSNALKSVIKLQKIETVIHILWECPIIKKVWLALQRSAKYMLQLNIQFTNDMIM